MTETFDIQVRQANNGDIRQLMQLENMTWDNVNSPFVKHWESETEYAEANRLRDFLVAEAGERLCGFVSWRPSKLESNAHVIEIAIAVHPDFQKAGVGSRLLDGIYSWAQENGKRKISLRVMSTNEKAIRFYARNGYLEEGRLLKEFYIDGKYVDDVLMYKWID